MPRPAVLIPAAALLGAAATLALMPSADASGDSVRAEGPTYVYSANAFSNAEADVHVVSTGSSRTVVTVQVRGVDAPAGTTFGAHLHVNACGAAASAAGGHYNSGVGATLEDREIWLDFTVDPAGNASVQTSRPWAINTSVDRSVVFHALSTAPDGVAGPRLACTTIDF